MHNNLYHLPIHIRYLPKMVLQLLYTYDRIKAVALCARTATNDLNDLLGTPQIKCPFVHPFLNLAI